MTARRAAEEVGQRRWRRWLLPSRRRCVVYGVVFGLLLAVLAGWFGCAARRREPQALPPGTVVDATLRYRLQRHLQHLAESIGPRHPGLPDKLAAAANYIEAQWQEQGHDVRRVGYTIRRRQVDNLEIVFPGRDATAPCIVIGAHYDTDEHSDTPGADDNASGVALLIELARDLGRHALRAPVRLVAFVCEEPPYFQSESMGSLVYARQLVSEGVSVACMITLESLGYFTDARDSQPYPLAPLGWFYPDRGNFVAVVGNLSTRRWTSRVARLLIEHSVLPVEQGDLPAWIPGVDWSDHWSFWQIGAPAIMLTDTAVFRNPHYHEVTDTVDTLDLDVMAELARALPAVVADLTR